MVAIPFPKKQKHLRKDLLSWLIALPSIALFIFFIWVPLLQNVVLSFQPAVNSNAVDFGFFDNYLGIFHDIRFQQAVVNTLLYVVYSLLIGFIIPIILALVISELIHTKSLFKIGFYIPNIVPAIAVILMWKIMMDANDYGFFNIILQRLGLGTSMWLSEKTMTIPLIILTLTWKSAGSTMLIYLATLQSIDPNLYEAARVHGAGLGKRLKYITLPALFANVKLLLIMQVISIFQIFYEPLVFMGSSNDTANTLGLLIYKYAFGSQPNIGYGAALGVITLIILLGFTFV